MPALKSPVASYLREVEVQVPYMTMKALFDLGSEKSDFIPSTLLAHTVPAVLTFSLFLACPNLCLPKRLCPYHLLCPQ